MLYNILKADQVVQTNHNSLNWQCCVTPANLMVYWTVFFYSLNMLSSYTLSVNKLRRNMSTCGW